MMDSLTIAALVDECNRRLQGAKISKIFQPAADELEFRLWTGRETLRLHLVSRPQRARFCLTRQEFPHPFTPPRFCQLLRARLTRLLSFEQVAGDRLVLIHFSGSDEARYRLVIDLRPKPNLVLLDHDDRIVDLLQRGGAGERPGDRYIWPEQNRTLLTPSDLPPVPPACHDARAFRKWLLTEVAPMSPLAADDLAACVVQGSAPEEALARFVCDLTAGAWQPRMLKVDDKPALAILPLYTLSPAVLARYASVNQAVDADDVSLSPEGPQTGLSRTVSKTLKKLRKRLVRIHADYAALDDLETLQQTGNLLLSNLYRVRRGMTEIAVEDYTADPPRQVTIPLDPRLTPQQNVDRLFKRARKRRRGEEHYARRLEETQQEIDWLESMALAIEESEDAVELDVLARQLAEAGYLSLREEPRRQMKKKASALLETTSPSGFSLVWGRNPRQNDHVSREIAAADDLWFHAHDMPGCHLLLRRAGRAGEVPEEDVLVAASLAAGYSRGRHDSRVEVMVTEARHVRKPKGARPGLVTVENYRTVVVTPRRLEET